MLREVKMPDRDDVVKEPREDKRVLRGGTCYAGIAYYRNGHTFTFYFRKCFSATNG